MAETAYYNQNSSSAQTLSQKGPRLMACDGEALARSSESRHDEMLCPCVHATLTTNDELSKVTSFFDSKSVLCQPLSICGALSPVNLMHSEFAGDGTIAPETGPKDHRALEASKFRWVSILAESAEVFLKAQLSLFGLPSSDPFIPRTVFFRSWWSVTLGHLDIP
jgi:hypothetical protein